MNNIVETDLLAFKNALDKLKKSKLDSLFKYIDSLEESNTFKVSVFEYFEKVNFCYNDYYYNNESIGDFKLNFGLNDKMQYKIETQNSDKELIINIINGFSTGYEHHNGNQVEALAA